MAEIELLRGAHAESFLGDESYVTQWAGLWDRCPWATTFQSAQFVTEWYRAYGHSHEPLLIIGWDDNGRLGGVLPLARPLMGGALVAAGSHQAEYQVWLCSESLADSFPCRALGLLERRFPLETLKLRYLPAETPLGWLADSHQRRSIIVKPSRRPLLRLGVHSEAEQALRKPGNKSRLRQLKKIGAVAFKRVTDPVEFGPLLDHLIRFHDCRQLAARGSAPFRNDPQKRPFHLALMNAPGLLHVTALWAGDTLASAQLNLIRNKEVQLFLIAHNPALERISPGKLHIHLLACMLKQEGYEQLDLTPGGEEYKDRFANASDTVHTLTCFPTPARRMVGVASAVVEEVVRTVLAGLNIKPARALSLVRRVQSLGLAGTGRAPLTSTEG
jgi:CelD/BcsL family acetyltransferase involved in cellulose biosynthesis